MPKAFSFIFFCAERSIVDGIHCASGENVRKRGKKTTTGRDMLKLQQWRGLQASVLISIAFIQMEGTTLNLTSPGLKLNTFSIFCWRIFVAKVPKVLKLRDGTLCKTIRGSNYEQSSELLKSFFNKRFNVNTFNMFVISVLSDERRLAFYVLLSALGELSRFCLDNAFWINAENKKSLCKQKLLQRDNTCQLKG